MAEFEDLDFGGLWQEAMSFEEFVATAGSLEKLWTGVYRTARVPAWAVEQAKAAGPRRLLCIMEDWCWDAANTVPVVAKLCDAAESMEVRVIGREEYPEVMDRYLTNGTRAIPIIVVLDETFRELSHWGPRPREIQAWAQANRQGMEKSDFYAELRRRYVKDRGESTLRELIGLIGKVPKG